jgi:hypothetical protein
MALALFENTDLAGGRPGVAHALNIGYFVSTTQLVELAAEYTVAVEIDQPAFLGHHIAEIFFGRHFGYLTTEFIGCFVPALGTAMVFKLVLIFA